MIEIHEGSTETREEERKKLYLNLNRNNQTSIDWHVSDVRYWNPIDIIL